MSRNSFNDTLCSSSTDGVPITSAQIRCIPDDCFIVLPNHFLSVGRVIRVTATGEITTPGAPSFAPNFNINVGTAGANLLIPCGNSGTVVINTVAKNRVPFLFSGMFTVRVASVASSVVWGIWKFHSEALFASPLPTVGGSAQFLQIPTTPAASSTFNYAAANYLNLTLTMNAVSVGIVKQYFVEALN